MPPHRPYKIIYASLYADVRPSFVVDISEQFETRFAALMAYQSQYQDQSAGSGLFPRQAEIRERLAAMAAFYGLLAGVQYAEPFVQKEVGLVEDLLGDSGAVALDNGRGPGILSLYVVVKCKAMTEATLSAKNQIVIPREARAALGLKPGDKILVVVKGKRVIVLQKPKSQSCCYSGAVALPAIPTII